MLNLRRLGDFKYYARGVLSNSQMEETSTPVFMANVIAKASRVSIQDAKSYVKDVERQGICTKEVSDNVCGLLDRYATYR